MSQQPMCGPAERFETGSRPMCGPKPGSAAWKKIIADDVRRGNLKKAREIRAKKEIEEIKDKK